MSNGEKCSCCVCESTNAMKYIEVSDAMERYDCPVCGQFEVELGDRKGEYKEFDFNKLGPFLLYNGFRKKIGEGRYLTCRNKEECDKWRQSYSEGNVQNGQPVHMSQEIIDNWYPNIFAEKIDKILLYLDKVSVHVGDTITLSKQETISLLFVDRYDFVDGKRVGRKDESIVKSAEYMLDYLSERKYVCKKSVTKKWFNDKGDVLIEILPAGYGRIDELQKNRTSGKMVLVAMKFGQDTLPLRNAIRKGVSDAGYIPIFIDEVEHNGFITPELLKYIKESKFVVVDLTHKNNGAYFEEGYAMGLGKPVIQLCRKEVRLHFDIAQKNTIMWETEDDIPHRLTNRIKATID